MSSFIRPEKTKHLILALTIIGVLIFAVSSTNKNSNQELPNDLKYKGAVLAHIHKIGNGYGSTHSQQMHKHLNNIGYNFLQLNTFAYMSERKQTKVHVGGDPSMAPRFVESEIENVHKMGFKVMLKPHIWIGGGDFDPDNWRSKIDFVDPMERQKWFSSYEDFILAEAELAETTSTEMLVVGTELVGVSKYTDEWRKIIEKIRKIYSGKLTYAAEGMNAQNIEFWNSLDYIGIDAYFPLTDKADPSLDELSEGWKNYEPQIKELSDKYDKQIIFTEIGFKSVKGTAIKPWQWELEGETSQQEQALAFQSASIAFKDKPYLAGIFIWKYFTDMNSYEKRNNEKGFTPYSKEAEKVISQWFGVNSEDAVK